MQVLLYVEVTYHAVFGLRLRVTGIDERYTLGQMEQDRLTRIGRLGATEPGNRTVQRPGEYRTRNKKQCALPQVIRNIALITAQDFGRVAHAISCTGWNRIPAGIRSEITLSRPHPGQGAENDATANA